MSKNEVGIAFLHPTPKFWNINFPPPDWRPFLKRFAVSAENCRYGGHAV
jgi:hypothetical protein